MEGEDASGYLRLPFGTLYKIVQSCTILYKVKNVKSSQGKIVGLRWSKGQSRFCTGLSHNHKVKTLRGSEMKFSKNSTDNLLRLHNNTVSHLNLDQSQLKPDLADMII